MTSTNSYRFAACGLSLALLLAIAGCDELDQAAGKGPPPKPGVSPVSQQFLPLDVTEAPKTAKPNVQPASGAAQSSANANQTTATQGTSQPPQPMSGNGSLMEKAEAGMGVKGQGYGGGMVTEPLSVYFRAQDRITFEIQIPHQLDLWKAEHNNRFPRDKNEYIKEILEPCGVDLPELPPGKAYYYDAKDGQLLVGPAPQK